MEERELCKYSIWSVPEHVMVILSVQKEYYYYYCKDNFWTHMLLSHDPTMRDLSSGIIMHDDNAMEDRVTLRTCLFSEIEYILRRESCPTDTTNCLFSATATAVTASL